MIIGHFYMLQRLLAVININLTKILNQESFFDITSKQKKLLEKQKEFVPDDNIQDEDIEEKKDDKDEPNEEQKKSIKELAKALKQARAAKLEA